MWRVYHSLPRRRTTTAIRDAEDFEGRKIAVVGGGLAGLSVAFHLLEKTNASIKLTLLDKAEPGCGGASSVAGGLLHPFSPRGKIIHWGTEGLASSSSLIDASQQFESGCVLRDRLYRVALTEANVDQLSKTAAMYPELASWLGPEEIEDACGADSLGGLVLANGCKVVNVPSYLRGLWLACEDLSKGTAEWSLQGSDQDWKDRLRDFDTVIFAAGSGMFQDQILKRDAVDFPADLIRGQSLEMTAGSSKEPAVKNRNEEAILCGKYVVPMAGKSRVLVGATHEYTSDPCSEDEVVAELTARTQKLCPSLWENGTVSRITSGYRVQSMRGQHGRVPIIGRSCGDLHDDAWLFTGLSSRGLIYHGIYGDILSGAVLEGNEESMLKKYPHLGWWKRNKK